MVVEFHGHTKQVDGVGDLMFYSKTGGSPQSGVFTAPWDGIHGWYLKNDSPKDVVVILELAGFYAIERNSAARGTGLPLLVELASDSISSRGTRPRPRLTTRASA